MPSRLCIFDGHNIPHNILLDLSSRFNIQDGGAVEIPIKNIKLFEYNKDDVELLVKNGFVVMDPQPFYIKPYEVKYIEKIIKYDEKNNNITVTYEQKIAKKEKKINYKDRLFLRYP